MRTYVFFFFSYFIDTLFLLCDNKPCTYDVIYIYIWWGCYYSSFTYLYMYCFFSLFMHVLFIIVCNLLFLFHTKMPWWVLFKMFQKYKLSKSSCHELSSCKVFQEFVLGYILLYSTNEYKLSDLWLLSYVHLFVVVLS